MAFVKEVYFQKIEWGEEGATSKMGVFFLEAFQIEVGLYCDVPGVSWKHMDAWQQRARGSKIYGK